MHRDCWKSRDPCSFGQQHTITQAHGNPQVFAKMLLWQLDLSAGVKVNFTEDCWIINFANNDFELAPPQTWQIVLKLQYRLAYPSKSWHTGDASDSKQSSSVVICNHSSVQQTNYRFIDVLLTHWRPPSPMSQTSRVAPGTYVLTRSGGSHRSNGEWPDLAAGWSWHHVQTQWCSTAKDTIIQWRAHPEHNRRCSHPKLYNVVSWLVWWVAFVDFFWNNSDPGQMIGWVGFVIPCAFFQFFWFLIFWIVLKYV